MIEEPARLRIVRAPRRPSAAQVDALRGHSAATVLDAMFGDGALDAAISPLPGQTARVCGPALTAGNGPGDILATLAALQVARPGDVLCAAFAGHQGCAAGGDRVMGMLRNAGGAGLVTDGPLRDLEGLRAVDLPAWCTGLTPASPVVRGPGTVGLPIALGGQRIAPGDVIVADADGAVVVPFERLDAVGAAVARVAEAERALDAEVENGFAGPSIADLVGDDVEWL